MARSLELEASQSARLLRIQRLREQRARAEAARAAAERDASRLALADAMQRREAMQNGAALSSRRRWDGAHGALMTRASLTGLREDEDEERAALRRLAEAEAEAQALAEDLTRRSEAASAAAALAAARASRREKLATTCKDRLQRSTQMKEELALEDDLIGREANGA